MRHTALPILDSQVMGFFILLVTQQLFHRCFNHEAENEWAKIHPVLKTLERVMGPEYHEIAKQHCIEFHGYNYMYYRGPEDILPILYCISNYRLHRIVYVHGDHNVKKMEEWEQHIFYTLENVCEKAAKEFPYSARQRFV